MDVTWIIGDMGYVSLCIDKHFIMVYADPAFTLLDLIAVLCPFGPLRLLIESSRTQQREVPALLYSVNAVWFMASMDNHFRISKSFLPQNEHVIGTNWIFGGSSRNSSASNLHELQPPVIGSNEQTGESVAGASTSNEIGLACSNSPERPEEAHTTNSWINSSGPQGAVIDGSQDGNGFTRLRGESVNTFANSHTDPLERNQRASSEANQNARNSQRNEDEETAPDEEDGKLNMIIRRYTPNVPIEWTYFLTTCFS
jgi:hypothetical protein